jgi:hypothetical protein
MGKRKGNFNGPDYYRKQMAGPLPAAKAAHAASAASTNP